MIHTDTSLKVLKLELEKCIPVCANCHREIHYKLGYIKDLALSPRSIESAIG